MNQTTLKRTNQKDKITIDWLKLLAFAEILLLIFILSYLLSSLIETLWSKPTFTIWGVLGGCIILLKKMYYDDATAELTLPKNINTEILNSAMLAIGYSKKEDFLYTPIKKMFSIFHHCKSEIITIKFQEGSTTFKGPYSKLNKLSTIIKW